MFSPRSSNYERLEGGMGPSRSSPGRKFAWKKFAIGAVVLIGLVYFFGPRREDLEDYVPGTCPSPLASSFIALLDSTIPAGGVSC